MLPPEHFGTAEKRTWYKVRWLRNPDATIEGKIDLVREEDLPEIREFVEILQEITAAKCAAGIRLGYGKTTESEIEKWIKENAKRLC